MMKLWLVVTAPFLSSLFAANATGGCGPGLYRDAFGADASSI